MQPFTFRVAHPVLCAISALCIATLIPEASLAQSVPITIVSVGDSYASGEGAPDVASPVAVAKRWAGDNTDGKAAPCHRSNNAAPVKAVAIVKTVRPVSLFRHFACSGAVIADLTGANGQLMKAAASVGAGGTIDALIISIGGNDIQFAAIVGACVLPVPCQAVTPGVFPAAVFALAPGLSALAAAVRAMPVTVKHVFVTEYPDPSTTPYGPANRCGSPLPPGTFNIPGSGFDLLDATKAEIAAVSVIAPLNATLLAATTAANTAGGGPTWHFVTGISQAFATHGYCMGWPNPLPHMWITGRMINTVADSLATQQDIMGVMHPNAVGDDAASILIAGAILANVPMTTAPPSSGSGSSGSGSSPTSFCATHPKDKRCHVNDECFNRHIPACK